MPRGLVVGEFDRTENHSNGVLPRWMSSASVALLRNS
jgi:hypothetical protein